MATSPSPEERANKTFGMPSTMATTYYDLLKKVVREAKESTHEETVREKTFIAHLIAISFIETFYNGFFQTLAEGNPESMRHKDAFYRDFNNFGFGLFKKIKQWPKMFFDKNYEPDDPVMVAFENLIDTRNHLTHFKSGYSTLPLSESSTISGLADITRYKALSIAEAENTLVVAKDMVEYTLRAWGVSETNLPWKLCRWTGIYPNLD